MPQKERGDEEIGVALEAMPPRSLDIDPNGRIVAASFLQARCFGPSTPRLEAVSDGKVDAVRKGSGAQRFVVTTAKAGEP